MKTSDLLLSIIRLCETKRTVSAFINGAPGSGKTFLLKQLAKELPKATRNTLVYGPYQVSSMDEFSDLLINDCFNTGYLNSLMPSDYFVDIIKTFEWLNRNIQSTNRQTITILIDLNDKITDIDTLRTWFSSIRFLEHGWNSDTSGLLILLASNWNHNLLDSYYKEIRLSFPYTVSQNYFLWDGISVDQMDKIITKNFPSTPKIVPLGLLLHEITGGHPGAAIDILETIQERESLTIASMLNAAKIAARNGKMAGDLVSKWSSLSTKTRNVIRHLLLLRQIPISNLRPHLDGLASFGLVKEKEIADTTYAVISSWYIEMVIRSHLNGLEIEDENLNEVDPEDLPLPLVSINNEAFLIINEIETMIRKFVIVRSSANKINGKGVLENRGVRYDKFLNRNMSAHERASDWRDKSRSVGLSVDTNPLVTYLSVKDLPLLVDELSREIKSEKWSTISSAINSMGDIRDAVMHNQIIDDKAFIQLFDLRAAIYNALLPESPTN